MTLDEILAARATIRSELASLQRGVELRVFRESTDHLGRLSDAMSDVDDVFDEAEDGQLSSEQAERAYAAFLEIAATAVGQLVFIRGQHPTVADDGAQVRS